MDAVTDRDWKKNVGFTINYNSGQSSDDDFDRNDVVLRHPRQSSGYLLEDGGDGAPADLLGTTPPRAVIRNKKRRDIKDWCSRSRGSRGGRGGRLPPPQPGFDQRQGDDGPFGWDWCSRSRGSRGGRGGRLPPLQPGFDQRHGEDGPFVWLKEGARSNTDGGTGCPFGKMMRSGRWHTMDNMYPSENATPNPPDRPRKRSSMKNIRIRERDFKMDLSNNHRADSLPSPNVQPPIPTLVESCNRFMSLTSRLKCREKHATPITNEDIEEQVQQQQERERTIDEGLPQNRVHFHKTFSLLIKMGNIDKSCRRAISLEEQVWQNELKDLIWLELQAKIAGRTPPQQDAFLCSQRDIVPTIIQNIIDYRFVNPSPCAHKQDRCDADLSGDESDDRQKYDYLLLGCLSLNCLSCTDAIGKALREVGTLLDSFYNAEALYPSSKAMASHHPLIATQLFNNRLKAMCLWYNIALHMRMKIMAVQRLVVSIKAKANARHRYSRRLTSSESECSKGNETPRVCTVRFNVDEANQLDNQNPSDSNNSDSSSNSELMSQQKVADEADNQVGATENDNQGLLEDGGRNEQSTPSTPEIHINDTDNNRNGTVDTTASTESGYLSDRSSLSSIKDFWSKCDENLYNVYNMGPLEEVVILKLLGKCSVSPYRQYHYEILKTQGVRKCMMFVHKMNKKILNKVYMTLEKENSQQSQTYKEDESVEVFEDTKDDSERQDQEPKRNEEAKEVIELRRYGCWSEETLQMRLPSYRNHFLLLTTICLETVHDYLSLRLETQPSKPSCLTVKQLIHELKEGLDIATEMRSAFVRNIDAALADYPADAPIEAELLAVIRTFDETVEKVLKQYLSYLTTMSEVEHMPRSTLEAEWGFTARLAKRMRCAAELGPLSFSDIVCNQMDRLIKQFTEKFARLIVTQDNISDDDSDEAKRHFVYALCRQAQDIYASERELTIQTVQFSRLLATRLKKNNRFVRCRERIFKSLMRIRDCIVLHADKIAEKTAMAPWEDFNPEMAEGLFSRIRELLMQVYKLSFELHKELHRYVYTASQDGGRVSRARPASLQPPRVAPLRPTRRRPETIIVNDTLNALIEAKLFHKEMHRFINDTPPEKGKGLCGGRRQSSGSSPPHPMRPRFVRSESIGGQDYDTGVFDDYYQLTTSVDGGVPEMRFEEDEPRKSSFATAISEANKRHEPAPEVDGVELRRVHEGEWEVQVSRAIIQFAKSWMKFVVERCDRGRGLRPRWASQGLEFLMLACDPCNTRHLTDEEFEELKTLMDGCISHVIGSTPKGPRPPEPAAAPQPARGRHHPRSRPLNPLVQAQSVSKEVPTPPTPPSELEPIVNFHVQEVTIHSRRVEEATQVLDAMRDETLRKMKAVGRLVESTAVTSYEPKLRQVTFKWQRGLKIGAGTFGKVYTVVNTETGQLLAMKEISIGVGDRRALQRAANELKVLEGIIHPHLVRYYGCEIHKEEMLIFMELCVEGSLEALLASGGALPEPQVRRYTKQLLSAVHQLHARNIAHRDIKSGNIFLTNEGHCLKLGDFGCAVKIRANTTAAGELMGCVGTQAYMAPEVFMKSTGHGRAADIWSLGCVVSEMASGKRPFAEYDSNYQIMFVVGMGGRPQIPPTLSDEGQEFCLACLTHDPEERPRAEALKMHHFLMIKSDNDCNCEPSYMITKKELN